MVRSDPPFLSPLTVKTLPVVLKMMAAAEKTSSATRRYLYCKATKSLFKLLHARLMVPTKGKISLRHQKGQRTLIYDGRNTHFYGAFCSDLELGYEAASLALLEVLIDSNGVFYDIGSNFGYFSLSLAAHSEFDGKIHAFEPHPSSFSDLESLTFQAGMGNRIICHQIALSDRDGTGTLRFDSLHSALTKIAHGNGGTDVIVSRLDSLDLPPPTILKIDVEDHELAVLMGADKLITHYRPAIIFESLKATPPGATFQTLNFFDRKQYALFVPAWHLGDHAGGIFFGEDTNLKLEGRVPNLALLPFEQHNRCFMGNNLNLLAYPIENVAALKQLFCHDPLTD